MKRGKMIKRDTLSTQKPLIKSQKAAIYIRVSTEEQAKEGYSLSAQEDALKNYAQSIGYSIFKIYRDEGKSAKDIKHRPALNELLDDAEKKRFNAVFVYKLDRFSRSLKDLILTIEKLKEWDVDFISLQDKIETASASGKLMFHIISSFAEFERDIISERTKFGMSEKARGGGIVTKPALGYKINNGNLVIDPEKSLVVKKIFNDFITTDKSLSHLAKETCFSTRGIIKLLKNRTYLGELKFKKRYKGSQEAIISDELFEKAAEKLSKDSYRRLFMKNAKIIRDILIQGDPRYYDSYAETDLAHFLSNDAVTIEQISLEKMEKPSDKEIEAIHGPQKEAKFVATNLLMKEGFSEKEILFEFDGGEGRPDVGVETDSRKIYVECHSCRISKVIDYLSHNIELWLLTNGLDPWDDNFNNPPKNYEPMKFFIFKKGPKWDLMYRNHIEKLKEDIKGIDLLKNLYDSKSKKLDDFKDKKAQI